MESTSSQYKFRTEFNTIKQVLWKVYQKEFQQKSRRQKDTLRRIELCILVELNVQSLCASWILSSRMRIRLSNSSLPAFFHYCNVLFSSTLYPYFPTFAHLSRKQSVCTILKRPHSCRADSHNNKRRKRRLPSHPEFPELPNDSDSSMCFASSSFRTSFEVVLGCLRCTCFVKVYYTISMSVVTPWTLLYSTSWVSGREFLTFDKVSMCRIIVCVSTCSFSEELRQDSFLSTGPKLGLSWRALRSLTSWSLSASRTIDCFDLAGAMKDPNLIESVQLYVPCERFKR